MGVRELDLASYDRFFVSIGGALNASVPIALVLKEAGVRSLWVRSRNRLHRKILGKVGTDRIINPELEMGKRVARQLVTDCLLDFVALSGGLAIFELVTPRAFIGKPLGSLRIPDAIQVLGVNRGAEMFAGMRQDLALDTGDILLLAGPKARLQKFVLRL